MTKLTATFRIVTPMFLGGAEPTREAELSLSSFKGALRFWWRALAWSEVQDIAEMRRREAALFGSSDSGQSRVIMRLETPLTSNSVVRESWSPSSWQRYTGYGLRDKGDRCFIAAGTEWTIAVNMKRCDGEQGASFVRALKLIGLAGGLGSRSRKGWGSITLVALDGASWQCPSDGASWCRAIDALLRAHRPDEAPFTAITRDSRWNAAAPQGSAERAQQWLGQHYRESVKETMPKADRAQFGLPRAFKKGAKPRLERRASPLFLHVHFCGGDRALPCALWLPSAFLEGEPAIPGRGESAQRFVETLDAVSRERSR